MIFKFHAINTDRIAFFNAILAQELIQLHIAPNTLEAA